MDINQNSPYLSVRSLSSPLATSGITSPRSARLLAQSAPTSSDTMENEATTSTTTTTSTENVKTPEEETSTSTPSSTTTTTTSTTTTTTSTTDAETASEVETKPDVATATAVNEHPTESSTSTLSLPPLKPSLSPIQHLELPVHVKTIAKKWLALTRSRRYSKKRSEVSDARRGSFSMEKARSFAPLSPRVPGTGVPTGPVRAASLDTIMLEKHHTPISTTNKLGFSSGAYLRGAYTSPEKLIFTTRPSPPQSGSDSDVSVHDEKPSSSSEPVSTPTLISAPTSTPASEAVDSVASETTTNTAAKTEVVETPASPSVEPAKNTESNSTSSSEPPIDRRAMMMGNKTLGRPPPLAKLVSSKAKSEATLDQFLWDNLPVEQAEGAVLDLALQVHLEQKGLHHTTVGPKNAPLTTEEAEKIGAIVQEIVSKHLPLAYVTNPTHQYSIYVNKEKLRDLVKKEFSRQSDSLTSSSNSTPLSVPTSMALARARGSLIRSSSATTFALSHTKSSVRPFASASPLIDSYAFQGGKKYMEDRIQVLEHLDLLLKLPYSASLTFVGIFDGHLGFEAAEIARVNTAINVARNESFGSDLQLALEEGFAKTNQDIISTGTSAGTTATVAFLITTPDVPGECTGSTQLVIGWVGDSKAILSSSTEGVRDIVIPHHPKREDEEQRIKAAGGLVLWFGTWRVNGVLAVSRSLGDKSFGDKVPPLPEIVTIEINSLSDEFVIMATDGLWDVFKPEEAADFVKNYVREEGTRKGVAKRLCERAYELDSQDNIAVSVIFLNMPTSPASLKRIASKNIVKYNNYQWDSFVETANLSPELVSYLTNLRKEMFPVKKNTLGEQISKLTLM